MNNSIVLKSPAKLNLTLEILDKYKDDFHEINSVVLNVNLFDEIKIEKSNRFEIYTNAEIDAKENLIYKAYQLLFEQYGKLPTKVNLTKNIPLDSGLGGGSSNAANFLQGMNKLWSLDLNKNDLKLIGNQLGMDVNLFYDPGVNFLKGKGNLIDPIVTTPKGGLIIFYDDYRIPKKTFRAYNMIRNSDFSNGKISEQLIDCIKGRSFNLGAIKCFNVFDKYINDLYPLTSEFKEYLSSQIDNNIYLAGSGNSLFCLFDDIQEARYIYDNIKINKFKKILACPWEE